MRCFINGSKGERVKLYPASQLLNRNSQSTEIVRDGTCVMLEKIKNFSSSLHSFFSTLIF